MIKRTRFDLQAGLGFLSVAVILAAAVAVRATTRRITPTINQGSTEIRAVWVYVGKGSQFPSDAATGKGQVDALVDKIAGANFNLILPWVRSEYLAGVSDPNYQKFEPLSSWDPLAELVSEAQKKGIKVHAWYGFTEGKSPNSPEFDPTKGGDPSWAARRVNELVPDASGKVKAMAKLDACPQHPEARKFEIATINSMLDKYPYISGIHIEEPGYRYPPTECVCDLCLSLFKSKYGGDLAAQIGSKDAEDFRTQGTTAFMNELRADLNGRPGQPTLTANGGYNSIDDRKLGRDWLVWGQNGLIDAFFAQAYTPNPNTFTVMTRRVVGDMGSAPVVMGVAAAWSASGRPFTNSSDVIVQEIEASRRGGAKGVALFYGQGMTDDNFNALKNGPFRSPAGLPSYIK